MKNKRIKFISAGIMTAMLCAGIGPASSLRAEAAEETGMAQQEEAGKGADEGSVLLSGGIQTYLDGIGTTAGSGDHVIMAVTATAALITPDGQVLVETASENEYADLAIADVTNYVNVRMEANTDSAIVGKIYDGAVAQILETVDGEDGQWFRIVSGNVEGYIKSEFFLYGNAAAEVIDQYVTRYAMVLADRLNVRENPDIGAKRIGFVDNGERVRILEPGSEWLKVQYTENMSGYVAAEYVTVVEEFVYAKTLEEEAAELEARRALEARQHVSESQAAENTAITAVPPSGEYSDSGELRSGIIEYAKQFLGNRYVHGGQSLESGTDCSGFTSLIYAQFGYSVSRTPSGQLANDGRSISYSEARPGDIICYGSGGKCTHVALYMGDGQIIHSANSRKGVVIYQADYDTIIGVKSIID